MFWLLAACFGGGDFTGEEPAWGADSHDSAVDDLGVEATVSELQTDAAAAEDGDDTGDVGGGSPLTLTGGTGTIAVVHTDIVEHCDADWSVDVAASDDDLWVTYIDGAAEASSELCVWTLQYTIGDLPPGEWTVHALDDEATTTVQ